MPRVEPVIEGRAAGEVKQAMAHRGGLLRTTLGVEQRPEPPPSAVIGGPQSIVIFQNIHQDLPTSTRCRWSPPNGVGGARFAGRAEEQAIDPAAGNNPKQARGGGPLAGLSFRPRRTILEMGCVRPDDQARAADAQTEEHAAMLETLRPDPTFHPSPRLAMEAERERIAYTALLSPDAFAARRAGGGRRRPGVGQPTARCCTGSTCRIAATSSTTSAGTPAARRCRRCRATRS